MKNHVLRKILLALLPTLVFTQNYGMMTGNKALGLGFLAIWLVMIWSAWQLTEKYHINERLLRLTELGFFLLPISAVIYTFVIGARVVGSAGSDAQQAGAAIGTAIGGTVVIGLMFVVGLIGGIIMHLITSSYDKKAEKSGVKQPETFANKNGVALSIVGVFALAIISGAIASVPTSTTSSTSNAPATQDDTPQLELQNFNFTKEYDFDKVEGTVKNITDKKLEGVQVVASYYDKDGNFIKSDDAMIKYNPILPGQISPFEAMGTDNPAIEKASVSFKYIFGGEIPTSRAEPKGKTK
jgi:hypothetical protein